MSDAVHKLGYSERVFCFSLRAGVGMNNLATTYTALGRHEDALAMQEKLLEFYRRVLPEDHPGIGEGRMSSDASRLLHLCVRLCDFFYVTCRRLHGQSRYDIHSPWKA